MLASQKCLFYLYWALFTFIHLYWALFGKTVTLQEVGVGDCGLRIADCGLNWNRRWTLMDADGD